MNNDDTTNKIDYDEEVTEGVTNVPVEDAEKVLLQQQVVALEDKYKRAFADYKNLERRTQDQKGEWIRSANKDLLLKLLPVLDTLLLAQKHIDDKGLQLSVDQFLRILDHEGLVRIKTIGEVFDPHTMEAVTTQPGEDGKVLEEIRPGFMMNEFVLRSAQVIVGKQE